MKRNKITLLLAAFLLVCGCSDFEEINVNPNNPPTVPANLLLPTVISTAVSSMTGSGNGAAGQFIQHINYKFWAFQYNRGFFPRRMECSDA